MNITERDRILLENLIFLLFFMIFMKTVFFSSKEAKREWISVKILIFSTIE